MKFLLCLWGMGLFAMSALVFAGAKGAIHEILGAVGLCAATVAFSGTTVADAVDKLRHAQAAGLRLSGPDEH